MTEATSAKAQKKESLLTRLRRQHPWLDHVLRANEAYGNHYGNHYAAAITYFSVLSIVPILMVAFSVVGFAVGGNQLVLNNIQSGIEGAVPAGLNTIVSEIIDGALHARGGIGVVGLLLALYSGIGWMSNLRDALTAQWGQQKKDQPIVTKTLKDLVSLVGLGLALVVSFALTAAGSGVGQLVLRAVGLADQQWARVLLVIVTVVLTLIADWLVFLWVIARLPRERVSVRSAVKGAFVASVGFVILQHLGSYYLASVSQSSSFAVFGPVLGLLVFANLVSRFLLYVTAWTATARDNMLPEPSTLPAVITPHVMVRRGPGAGGAAGLVGAGALLAAVLGCRRGR